MIPSTPQPAFEPRSTIIRAVDRGQRAVLARADSRWVTCAGRRVRRLEVLAAGEDEAHRAAERERCAGRERLEERELAAERAAERLRDDADPLERQPERAGELAARHERALRARRDDERSRRLEPRRRDLRLEVGLVDPGRAERPRDDGVARVERGCSVPELPVHGVEDVPGELLLVAVLLALRRRRRGSTRGRRRPRPRRLTRASGASGQHGASSVDDRRERLVLDDDRLGAVLGGRLGLGDDQRDRLAGEDDLLARERLRRPVRARVARSAGRRR